MYGTLLHDQPLEQCLFPSLLFQLIASPGSLDAVKNHEDGMLWIWRAHNQVLTHTHTLTLTHSLTHTHSLALTLTYTLIFAEGGLSKVPDMPFLNI